MAVAESASQSNTATSTAVHTFSATLTSGQPYMVRIDANPAVIYEPIVSVTYNGVALTSQGSQGGSNDKVFIYTRADGSGADGSAHNVVITYTDTADQSHAVATSFSGAHASAPFADFNSATGTSTTASVAIANNVAGDLAVDVVGCGEAITVGAGQTQDANLNSGGHRGGFSQEAGSGSVTMSWTLDVSGTWYIAGIRVVQAAGGETITPDKWLPRVQEQRGPRYAVMPTGLTPPNRVN